MPFNFTEARIQEVTNNVVEQAATRLQAEVTPEARVELKQKSDRPSKSKPHVLSGT
jgi:hypothetical protein